MKTGKTSVWEHQNLEDKVEKSKDITLHILSNSQSMTFFILSEEYGVWLNKIGRIDVPEKLVEELYKTEDDSVDFKEYSKEFNKEVFRSLVDNDFSVLDSVYKTLKFPNFNTVMDLTEFLINNNLRISFERYDISEGL